MKTEEELQSMSKNDLVTYAMRLQLDLSFTRIVENENGRLKEILSCIGIAYETYKREMNGRGT